jgi:excisionase family DNA binding protein
MRAPKGPPESSTRTSARKPQTLHTVAEAAEILNCSEKTVRRRIQNKRLRAIRDEGLLRIDPADLEDYIRDHRSR